MPENKFGFDKITDRRNTNCGRWDTMDQKYGRDNLIHLGVADMDFAAPQPIIEGFRKCVDHGIFGYTDLNDGFYEGIIRWMKDRHDVETVRDEIVFCPRINIASSVCVETLTEADEEVIINTPAYGPLYQAIVKNGRKVVESPLRRNGDRYEVDFENLNSQISEKTKMYILCSPHNPVGRVWTREELMEIGKFCLEHKLVLFVDEIHGDIVAQNTVFTSILSLPEEIRDITVVATSLTKTFNVPGVIVSYMIIPNSGIREAIRADIDRIGMHNPTVFSVSAVENGYTKCDDWYEAMLAYIDENEAYTRKYFEENFPEFHIYPREGTYLLWMGYQELGCTEEQLEKWFIEEAKVSVYMGTVFQEEGRGFIRVNIASPRVLLEQAYSQMKKAYDKLK